MAVRFSRSLLQINHRLCAAPSLPTLFSATHAVTRRNGGQRVNLGWQRLSQINSGRCSHTEPGSSYAFPHPSNVDATIVRGSPLTERHWASQDLAIVDRLMEPQTPVCFLGCAVDGVLPNGKETVFPLMTADEIGLLFVPTAEWEPAPSNPSTLATTHQIMVRIGSYEDEARLCLGLVGKNIHSFKARLWDGLAPLSSSRWAEKDLSNPEYFDIACEYLTAVIAVFEYLNIPQVRTNLRYTFNLISGHLRDAESALNARRCSQGQSQQLNLTGLWEEFIRAKYEVMTAVAHSWVLSRVAELREPLVDQLCAVSSLHESQAMPELGYLSERFEKLARITQAADLRIWMSMDRYHGYQPSSSPDEIVAGLRCPNLYTDRMTYQERWEKITFSRLAECIKEQEDQLQDLSARQSPSARRARFSTSTIAQDQLRKEIRGSSAPQLVSDPWIQYMLQRQKHLAETPVEQRHDYGFGLAVYRTAHEISDEQWEDVRRKVQAHLSAWGHGIEGAEEIKPLLELHWFDSKQLDIRDTEAAKRHFQKIRNTEAYTHKLDHHVFLIIDPCSVASYTDPTSYKTTTTTTTTTKNKLHPGDSQPHLLAIDADFDPNDPEFRAEESPGFDGQMRIQGNLVWAELYPMMMLQSTALEDLWPMAMEHPMKVYTGLTVPGLREGWRECNMSNRGLLRRLWDRLGK